MTSHLTVSSGQTWTFGWKSTLCPCDLLPKLKKFVAYAYKWLEWKVWWKLILSNYSNKPHIDEKSVILSHSIPPGDLLSLLGKWISWWWNLVHFQSELICWLITVISENASSRKLGNWNWFSQPLVHTVMDRNLCPSGTYPIHKWMNSWLGKPSSSFPTSWKRYIYENLDIG